MHPENLTLLSLTHRQLLIDSAHTHTLIFSTRSDLIFLIQIFCFDEASLCMPIDHALALPLHLYLPHTSQAQLP